MITAFFIKCVVMIAAQNQMKQINPFSTISPIRENMCSGKMDGIIFPDPDHCDAYVQCRSGAVIRQRCQNETLFDLKLYYCVPFQSIDCGRRRRPISIVIPDSSETPSSSEQHHSVTIYMIRTEVGVDIALQGLS